MAPGYVDLEQVLRSDNKLFELAIDSLKIYSQLTGQPSDIYLRLLSVMFEQESRLMAVSLLQYLLMSVIELSVIFLHSDRSRCSMLWQ